MRHNTRYTAEAYIRTGDTFWALKDGRFFVIFREKIGRATSFCPKKWTDEQIPTVGILHESRKM